MTAGTAPEPTLHGGARLVAGLVLGMSNFMVVLDSTIANVSVPHIAGGLAISPSQGTWVITSYAVASAVSIPLTGWLSARFGAVRTFVACMVGFGACSLLCGLATSLAMLVLARLAQGLSGGPLLPLTQALLLRIFPPHQHARAMGIWSITTVIAPILGPILGGTISDNWSWHWIFFINLPVAGLCSVAAHRLLRAAETGTRRVPVDRIGLALMLVWVAALQVMLDLGQDRDWFNDTLIRSLAVVAVIGCLVFIAWELTEEHPIVDLGLFRYRGFSASVVSISFAFGTFFASAVIVPLWLQRSMGYTATWAGYVTAFNGISGVIASPLVAKLMPKLGARMVAFLGILWLALAALIRVRWFSGADFWTLALPHFLQGFGATAFFMTLTTLGLATLPHEEIPMAAGLMNFVRTLAGAIATSFAVSSWTDAARVARSEMVGRLQPATIEHATSAVGLTLDQLRAALEMIVDKESMALATDRFFLISAALFVFAAAIVWLCPAGSRRNV